MPLYYQDHISVILEIKRYFLSGKKYSSSYSVKIEKNNHIIMRKDIIILRRQAHKQSSEVHLPCGILKQTKPLRFSEAGS